MSKKKEQQNDLGIVYQIYVPSFMDSKDDGTGDLNGIGERLDYLVQLGVDTIILSPLYLAPSTEPVTDTNVDRARMLPIYGAESDLTDLINKAHRQGLRLLMDISFNFDLEPADYIVKVLNGWLKLGLDGFRLNLEHPLDEGKRTSEAAIALHRKMAEIRQGLSRRDAIMVGMVREPYDGLAYLAGDELTAVSSMVLMMPPKHFGRDKWLAESISETVNARRNCTISLESYLTNRAPHRLGGERFARALAVLQLTLPATPCLYQGQELGLMGSNAVDSRRPMPWLSAEQVGFTSGKPWLDVSDDAAAKSVETQDNSQASLLNFYRRLIDVRKSTLALETGEMRLVENTRGAVCYVRTLGESAVMVYLNLSGGSRKLEIPVIGSRLLIASHPDSKIGANNLRPGEAVVTIAD